MQRPDGLPDALWARACKRTAPLREGRTVSLITLMQVKGDLCAHLDDAAAFEGYLALTGRTGPSDRPRLRELPLGSLGEALAASPEPCEVLNAGGARHQHRSTVVYGPAQVPVMNSTGRRVLAGWLRDVTVHARSAMILQGDRLLMDGDAAERTVLPVEMAFDPVIFRRTGPQDVAYIDDPDPARSLHLPAALSLLGINTVSFGHWILEYLAQFLGARKHLGARFLGPDAPPLPVLIDADMPAQHAQSLMFFGHGGGPELIRVPRGHRVRVDRLFAVQNWLFSPHLLRTDRGLDLDSLGTVPRGLGAIYRYGGDFAGRRIEASQIPAPDRVAATRRLFWARRPTRHRSIENWEHLRLLLEERGYVTCFPEEMSFARQVAAMRAADRIVVQNGSGSLGLMFARPETRVLYLSHPEMSRLSFQIEAMAAAGIEMRVLAGPFTQQAETWVDQSNYRIDMRDAEPALEWLDEGLAPAPAKPPKPLIAPCPPPGPEPEPDGPPMPPAAQAALDRVAAGLADVTVPDLWQGYQVKSRLAAHFPPEQAHRRYVRMLGAEGRMHMTERPLVGLLDRLRAEGQDLAIRDAPEVETTLSVARLVGPGAALDLTRVPRVVAGGWLDGAQVFGRSGTILHEGAVLVDRQGDEAQRVPQELASDAVLFGRGDAPDTAVFIDENRPERQLFLSSAWSLLGQNSAAFGHWTFETLANVLTWRDRPDLEGIPLLVDADMPPQHRQSLDLLAAGRFPIVPVPSGGRVFVSRLFATTNWYYTPHLMAGDPLRSRDGVTDFNVFGANAAELARVFRDGGAWLGARAAAPRGVPPGVSERLYLVRRPGQYRKLCNADRVGAALEARGFVALCPDTLPFEAQIRAVRGAREIVSQAGSQSHLALFARPGTRMCLLHHPGTRTIAMIAALLQEIGVDLTLAVGPFVGDPPKGQGYADRNNYAVPVGRLDKVLDRWDGDGPAAPDLPPAP